GAHAVDPPATGRAPPTASATASGGAGDSRSHGFEHGLVRDLDVYVPPSFEVDPRDRVRVQGLEYEIVGNVQDFTHGPFGFKPGGVLPLKRDEELGAISIAGRRNECNITGRPTRTSSRR